MGGMLSDKKRKLKNSAESYRTRGFITEDEESEMEKRMKKEPHWFFAWFQRRVENLDLGDVLGIGLGGALLLGVLVGVISLGVMAYRGFFGDDRVQSCYVKTNGMQYELYGYRHGPYSDTPLGSYKSVEEAKKFADDIGCPLYKK